MNMKKFLAIVVALSSISAFAQRHMVTLSGYENDRQDRSLDLYNAFGGANGPAANARTRNIALNYAFAVTNFLQVGALYKNYENTIGGDQSADDQSSTTMGLFVIYNFAHRLTDTNYLGLKYTTQKFKESDVAEVGDAGDDDDKLDTWSLEFGHRFSLGTLWNMNFNFSPSVELAFAKFAPAESGRDDSSTTEFRLNVIKFDVLF
jgi:hypothetical protein